MARCVDHGRRSSDILCFDVARIPRARVRPHILLHHRRFAETARLLSVCCNSYRDWYLYAAPMDDMERFCRPDNRHGGDRSCTLAVAARRRCRLAGCALCLSDFIRSRSISARSDPSQRLRAQGWEHDRHRAVRSITVCASLVSAMARFDPLHAEAHNDPRTRCCRSGGILFRVWRSHWHHGRHRVH
jgi:hypothetical protein